MPELIYNPIQVADVNLPIPTIDLDFQSRVQENSAKEKRDLLYARQNEQFRDYLNAVMEANDRNNRITREAIGDLRGLVGQTIPNQSGLIQPQPQQQDVSQQTSSTNNPAVSFTGPNDDWYLVHEGESGGRYDTVSKNSGEFSIGRRQLNVRGGGLDDMYNYVVKNAAKIPRAQEWLNAFSPLRVNGSFTGQNEDIIENAFREAVKQGYWQAAEDMSTQYKYFDEPLSRLNPEVREWILSSPALRQFFASRSVQTGQGAIPSRLNSMWKELGGNKAAILDKWYSPEYTDSVLFPEGNRFRREKPQVYWNMTRGPKGRWKRERAYLKKQLGY